MTEHAPAGVDTTVPHSARIYDWWLGGTDNFEVDRQVGAGMIKAIPNLPSMAKENRRFVHRAARYLARDAGIRQFLDIGTGIPTRPNLHEIVQEAAPDARIVYVDNDPTVLAHSQGFLSAGSTYVHGDLREPDEILATLTLDLTRPVSLTLIAVLMLLADAEDPIGKVRTLRDALPAGSYLTVSSPSPDFNPEEVNASARAATEAGMTLVPRSKADLEPFFGDWEMVDPGLVPVLTWRPETPPADPNAAYYYAGMARKP